jgi:hypothetical protein
MGERHVPKKSIGKKSEAREQLAVPAAATMPSGGKPGEPAPAGKGAPRRTGKKEMVEAARNAPARKRRRRSAAAPKRRVRKSRGPGAPTAAPTEKTRPPAAPAPNAVLKEIREVKSMLHQLLSPPSAPDADLEGAVHALRRLLSELIEERLDAVIRDLVDLRGQFAGPAKPTAAIARLDALIEQLGAVRFEAAPLDVVDPLIHVVAEERQSADVPDGVILKTVGPGYRTSRGIVLCKAAVAVNRNP